MMPLVSGLCAIIPGGISVEDYAIATSTDHVSAKSMLLDLVEEPNRHMLQEKQSFEFNDGDRLRAANLDTYYFRIPAERLEDPSYRENLQVFDPPADFTVYL